MRAATAIDFETSMVQPAQAAPPAVCMVATDRVCHVSEVEIYHARFDRQAMKDRLVSALTSSVVLGAHLAYDMVVAMREFPDLWDLIFDAYEQDRCYDLILAEKLIDIATDIHKVFKARLRQYNLADISKRRLGVDLDKDTWRLRYGTLLDVPLAEWEPGAIEYPRWDARTTFDIVEQQIQQSSDKLADVFRQTRAAFWVQLMVCHGFQTDPRAVSEIQKRLSKEIDDLAYRLRVNGLLKPDGKKDTKMAVARMRSACDAKGIAVKMTEGTEKSPPKVALDEDACLASGDPILKMYARYTSLESTWTKVSKLSHRPIQSRFDLADTGRTTCSEGKGQDSLHGFQLQNVNREPGVRECFVPRPGCLLLSVDYGQMELHTWSQVCLSWLGHSELAKLLNAKVDCHMTFGCRVMKHEDVAYAIANKKKEPFKKWRQDGKAGLFGFPGGLGAATFVEYAKANYGIVDMTLDRAKTLKAVWQEMCPESYDYFEMITSIIGGERKWGVTRHLFSDRYRAGVGFTDACNGPFQGLAADCAKDAGFHIAKACYLNRMSNPLYGSRVVNFVHDEFILEVPETIAHECAVEVVRIMEEAGKRWCPDVPPRAEPALMRRWIKAAEPVYENGRLVPWEPKAA